jgi:membrane-bound serine protease (ClpP class)
VNYLWPAILQALAFGVAMAEVIVPSLGLLAIISISLLTWSWFMITELPRIAAIWFGLADIILFPIGIRYAFKYLGKSSASHTTDLGTGSGLEFLDQDLSRHVGNTATVDAALRPTGKIRVGDEVFEAQTSGEFVDRGSLVKVVSVAGSRFQVEKA